MASVNGQSARYRKHLEYEARLDTNRAMSLAVHLRLMSLTNYGILYNPYDTDYAGFNLFLSWALRVDLLARSQSIDFQIGKRDCQFPVATWVVAFVSKYVLGLRHYSHLHTAIQDEYLRSLLGLESIPDVSSISRGHEELHPRAMKHAYHDFIQKTAQEQKLIGHLIAIDSTFLVTYGKTYTRTAYGYKPKGKKGYRLTIAYDVDSCFPICFLLAPANRHDSKMLCRTVNEVERFLFPDPQRIYLFDKGYWKGANFNKLDKQGYRFITQVKWYPNITKTLENLFETKPLEAWEQREIVINSERFEIKDFEKKLRVIALANRRARRLARQEANKEDPDSNKDEVNTKKKRPFCLLTNAWDIPTKKVVSYYERRWEIEQFIRQAKQDWHLGTFCNTEHNTIKSHIWLLFYSYSLIQLFRREVMSQAGVESKAVGWLRQELFIRSGRLYPRPDGGLTITFSHRREIDQTILPVLLHIWEYLQLSFLSSLLFLGQVFNALSLDSSHMQILSYGGFKILNLLPSLIPSFDQYFPLNIQILSKHLLKESG